MEQAPDPVTPEGFERTAPALEPSAIVEIDHYELDGVPLFHLPMVGSTVLALVFRVGRADEPVPRGGMTHLAEHLVLTSISDALDHSNGTTEPFFVTFIARGTPQVASRFLRDVCHAIEKFPAARMYQEANVLRTEAAGRGGMGMSLRLMWARTGYQGIGTFNLPELFLRSLDERALRSWVEERFVAGNAAIWIAGELPDDLEVSLAPGPRQPPPEVAWIPGLETPTLIVDDAPGVGASFFVERSTATATAFRVLDRRLRQALRVDRGLGYEVGGEYMPVSADRALTSIWTTCLPNATQEVQQIVLEAIDDIAARGPSDEDLGHQYEGLVRALNEPMAAPGRLDRGAKDLLLGEQRRSAAELADEQWRLESDEVAEAFRRARDSMLLLIPPSGRDPQRPFRPYPGVMLEAAGQGRTFDLAAQKGGSFWRRARAPKLAVGADAVLIDGSDGARLAGIRWPDCVAVVCEPDERHLIGRDGVVLQIVASEWRDGKAALRLIDELAPHDVVVPETS